MGEKEQVREKTIEEEYGFSDSDDESRPKVDMSKPETPEEKTFLDEYMNRSAVKKYIQGGRSHQLRELRAKQTRGQALLRMRLSDIEIKDREKSRQFYDRIERQKLKREIAMEEAFRDQLQKRKVEEEANRLIDELLSKYNLKQENSAFHLPLSNQNKKIKNEPIEIDDDDDDDDDDDN